jgi:hypothetical protein
MSDLPDYVATKSRVLGTCTIEAGLAEVRPTVWRRIQVPADYSLARLHGVIQAVMDWQDYHLHEFTVGGRPYGDPDLDEENRVIDERTVHLRDVGPSLDLPVQGTHLRGEILLPVSETFALRRSRGGQFSRQTGTSPKFSSRPQHQLPPFMVDRRRRQDWDSGGRAMELYFNICGATAIASAF